MVAFAEPDSTLTPALLSPEIQASRRTIAAVAGDEPEIRVRIDQPLNDAVELIEQAMVQRALDRTHGRVEERRAPPWHIQERTVPEAAEMGAEGPASLRC